MPLQKKIFFNITEASQMVGVSPDTLRRLEAKGKIKPADRIGGRRLFSLENIILLKELTKKSLGSKTHSIEETANILNVSKDTIRRWENKGIIKSQRTPGGHRRFTSEAIESVTEKRSSSVEPAGKTVEKDTKLVKSKFLPLAYLTFASLLIFFVISFVFSPRLSKPNPNVLGISTPTPNLFIKLLSYVIYPVRDFYRYWYDTENFNVGTEPANLAVNIPERFVESIQIALKTIKGENIADNTITADHLSPTLIFSANDLIDLSAISHITTSKQGLILPNVSTSTIVKPTSGEGYIAFDTSSNNLVVYDGTSWQSVGGGNMGDITGVAAGNGLRGGGGSGYVTLSLKIPTTGTSLTKSSNSGLEAASAGISLLRGCANGQLLKWNSTTLVWECSADSSGTLTEADTLSSVTSRGATTTDSVTIGGLKITGTDCSAFLNGGTLTTDSSGKVICANDDGGSASLTFDSVTSGTNTTATMIVGSGASLATTGTGTISATDLTCVGCVANSELTNSAITVNTGGILSGGAAVSLGGTLNLTATEADTLNSVTGRGASTANTITVGDLVDSGLSINKTVFTDGASQLTSTGTVGPDQGGTGFSTYAVGDMLYADTTATLAKLADVATGNVLIAGGIGVAPSWNKVVLGTHTTGNYVSTLTGTANQITASASTGDITLTIPSDFRAPGTVNAVNGIYTGATAGTQRIDSSGNLTSIGTTQFNGETYTWPSTISSNNYVLQTQTDGTLAWVDPAAAIASNIYWTSANGTLFPKNSSLDVLIGSDSTASAKFAFTGVNSGIPNININNVSVLNATTLGTGVLTSSLTSVGALASGSIASGFGTIETANSITGTVLNGTTGVNTGAVAGTQRIDSSGNLTNIGTTQFNTVTYTWPATISSNNYVLQTQTDGTLAWIDPAAAIASGIYWTSANGALFPKNNSLDVLIGADSTASAKFAFTGVNGGLPTASISGNVAGAATYLTGNGNLATTNMTDLILGGNTTGNITLNPSNAIDGGFVAPDTTNVSDFGTSSLLWRNIYATTLYQGINQVCDLSGNCTGSSTVKWIENAGTLSPYTSTLDVLIGSNATTSAKFAFTNVNSGTPTASISGTTANVATYLTGIGYAKIGFK